MALRNHRLRRPTPLASFSAKLHRSLAPPWWRPLGWIGRQPKMDQHSSDLRRITNQAEHPPPRTSGACEDVDQERPAQEEFTDAQSNKITREGDTVDLAFPGVGPCVASPCGRRRDCRRCPPQPCRRRRGSCRRHRRKPRSGYLAGAAPASRKKPWPDEDAHVDRAFPGRSCSSGYSSWMSHGVLAADAVGF